MWEEAVKAPLIIQAGDAYGRGRVIESLVEFVDLAPTLLDAVGVEDLPASQGKSLMPLLREKTGEHKEYVFSEFMADNKAMVRNERWKYIFTTGKHDLAQGYATGKGAPGITHRLYDLKTDPGETTNLADKPQYQDIKKKLQRAMIAWFKETYPKKLPSDKNTIEEKLVWFCRPTEKNPDLDAK
jgi:choline-sulfatase